MKPLLTPQARNLMRYFEYGHLPEPLRSVSEQFHELALAIACRDAVDAAEQTVALRKLLEAKDAAVRSVLPEPTEVVLHPPAWAPPAIYREGWEAALSGEPSSANPHEEGGTNHGAWIVGFSDALAERGKG